MSIILRSSLCLSRQYFCASQISSNKNAIGDFSTCSVFKRCFETLSDPKLPKLLSGDTPTGKLHLGHWCGSLQNRVKLQKSYDSFFLIANYHAMSTKHKNPELVHKSVVDITIDYLSAGIDPEKSTIFVQSDVSAIHELMFILSMLVTPEKLMQNPTLKSELKDKMNNKGFPLGFLLYPLGQVADILSFRAEVIPVGSDQVPHIEFTRSVAKKFNNLYGQFFPLPEALLSKENRLVGIDPPEEGGRFRKMSKSFGNAIYLSDSSSEVQKKVKRIYTDPLRLSPQTPGNINNNPLWIFHDAFNKDLDWVEEAKRKYTEGKISDRECKEKLTTVINELLEPMREKRHYYESKPNLIFEILSEGSIRANRVANETLNGVKEKLSQRYRL